MLATVRPLIGIGVTSEAYPDEPVRRAMSVWTRVGPDAERRVARELGDDLDSGRWSDRNHDLVDLVAADLGLRPLVG